MGTAANLAAPECLYLLLTAPDGMANGKLADGKCALETKSARKDIRLPPHSSGANGSDAIEAWRNDRNLHRYGLLAVNKSLKRGCEDNLMAQGVTSR